MTEQNQDLGVCVDGLEGEKGFISPSPPWLLRVLPLVQSWSSHIEEEVVGFRLSLRHRPRCHLYSISFVLDVQAHLPAMAPLLRPNVALIWREDIRDGEISR